MADSDTLEAENPRAVIGGNNPPSIAAVLAEKQASLVAEVEAIAEDANGLPKKIEDDEKAGDVAKVVKDARALGKRVDEIRKKENEPHSDAIKATNTFFNLLADRLTRIGDALTERLDTRRREVVAAERRRLAEEHEREQVEAKRLAEEAASTKQGSVAEEIARKEAEEAQARADRARRAAMSERPGFGPTRTTGGTVSTSGRWTAAIDDASKIDLNKMRSVVSLADMEKIAKAFARKNKDTVAVKGVRFFKDDKTSVR